MIKHIILWNLKDEYDAAQKEEIKAGIKDGLEGLAGKIPGLIEIKVYTEPKSGSNCDLMLYSVFEDEESLSAYGPNPLHADVANSKVRPFTAVRTCINCEE